MVIIVHCVGDIGEDILSAAMSMKADDKGTPGDLLYEVGLLESLINAAYLINQEKKKSPIDIPEYGIFNPNYFRGQTGETIGTTSLIVCL